MMSDRRFCDMQIASICRKKGHHRISNVDEKHLHMHMKGNQNIQNAKV